MNEEVVSVVRLGEIDVRATARRDEVTGRYELASRKPKCGGSITVDPETGTATATPAEEAQP